MTSRFSAALAFVVGCALQVSAVAAQSSTATLTGTVVDETAAVVPSAAITVVNTGTGLRWTTITGAEGTFVVPFLPPGTYRVVADVAGFAPVEIPDLVLNVGDATAVQLPLEVAPVGATITVTVERGRVSTLPSVSTVVDRQFVANLPLNGRSFQSLITMTPGVVPTVASSSSPGQFSVNGQRSDANYFMVDGVSANVGVQSTAGLGPAGAGAAPGLSAQGGTNSLVSIDALQEFKIESSTYAAEFGRSPGGQIAIVTRSGTNQFQGSIFEYMRHDALDSADYFVERQGLTKPEARQHNFGGVFGGPIRRNRMFVFVSYEGLRLDQPRSAVSEVPSLESRRNASEALEHVLAAFPLPTGPETASGLAQYSASYADPSRLDATSVRMDYAAGGLNFFGRYNYAPSEGTSRLGSFAAASANTIGWVKTHLQTMTAGVTWMPGGSMSNDLRVNWSRNRGTNFQTLDTFGGAVVPPAGILHPSFAPPESVYRVNLGAANVFFDEGPNSSNIQRQINVVNTFLFTKARHTMKAGIDYRRLLPVYGPARYVQAYTFDGVAGVLSGIVANALTAASSSSNRNSHATNVSAYIQDQWAVSDAVTLTYGLRWELDPAPGLNDSDEAWTLTSADPASFGRAPAGTPMYRTTYDNFAPRLGASYRMRQEPGKELVLRGGWGVYFDLPSLGVMNNLSQTFPFTARRSFFGVAFPIDPGLLEPPSVAPGAPADFLVASDPALELPYTHQWNVAADQALGRLSTVSVTYVGALGRRLLSQERVLDPNPQFQVVTLGTNRGHSRYHSLQLKLTNRLTRGLQALVSYTLADSKDNISTDAIPVLPFFRSDPDLDWGPSDFDIRHTFSSGVTYAIGRGWSVDAIVAARSAAPVNVVTGATVSAVTNALRPDLVPGVALYVDDDTTPGGRRFNRAAFTTAPLAANGNPLRQGSLPRNALRGFAMSQVDFAVHKEVRLPGGANVGLRAEVFNLLDRVSFGPPVNTMASGLFGQPVRTLASSFAGAGITGGGRSPLYQVGGPRSIQIAVKFRF